MEFVEREPVVAQKDFIPPLPLKSFAVAAAFDIAAAFVVASDKTFVYC